MDVAHAGTGSPICSHESTVGALFTLLSINILADFLRTGRLTGLLLLDRRGRWSSC